MIKTLRILCVGLMLSLTTGSVNADLVTFTGNTLIQGSINGGSVVGQMAVLTIDYSDSLTFSGGTIDFGANSHAVVEIGGVDYSIDPNGTTWGINVRPGYFSWADPAGLVAISPSDDNEIFSSPPIDGETLTQYLDRIGFNGGTFTPELVLGLGTGLLLNNGSDTVTQTIFGTPGAPVTVTASNAGVPEPSSLILFSFASLGGLLYSRRKRI